MNICGTCKKEHEEASHQYVVSGDSMVECDDCWEKFRRLANGLPVIPLTEEEIAAINKDNIFITYKPFTDSYALGSLREPKTFSSHTAWENHANKMNPGAYVNHKE